MADTEGEPSWLQSERAFQDDRFRRGTIPELFESSAARHADETAQLYKGGIYDRTMHDVIPPAPDGEFTGLTYSEMRDVVRRLAAGFRALGLTPDDRVAIFANTRMEWAQTDFALLAAGCVVTTVYTESSPKQVRYLLDDPGATAVVVENEKLLDRVLEVEDELDLETIVLIDHTDYDDREDIYTLSDVHALGEEHFDAEDYQDWLAERSPDDLASLIYTSGTTGQPKGVELTHWNFRSNVHQTIRRVGPRPDRGDDYPSIDADTTSISFLPLAHVFERMAGHFLMLGSGAAVGYVEHPDTISEDISKIKPTTGASVPRVYERIFDTMREQAGESGLKRRIFDWALGVASEYQSTGDPGLVLRAKHALADRLVYSTVAENLGGELEFMVSGGGSLSAELCRLFNGMGIKILEGYGLTETSPVITVNPPEDIRPGTLGAPVVGVDVAIDESKASPSEFGDSSGPVGELLVRGANVSNGYWNNPEETDASFVAELPARAHPIKTGEAEVEGKWFRTGDLVERTTDDFLVFHDRLKQLLVLSTGKNVAPAPIEDLFAINDRVSQVMVIGDGRKYVSALIVPNFEQLQRWAETNGIDLPTDREALCADDRVREWVGEAVAEVNAELESVERVKQFELVPREWTAENDLLTPSMKKKRRNIVDVYADRIDAMYENGRQETQRTTD